MVDNQLLTYSSLGILVVSLVAAGIVVSDDATHFCEVKELTENCDRLSSTEKTCYPETDTTSGKIYCSSGWIPIDRTVETLNHDELIITTKSITFG